RPRDRRCSMPGCLGLAQAPEPTIRAINPPAAVHLAEERAVSLGIALRRLNHRAPFAHRLVALAEELADGFVNPLGSQSAKCLALFVWPPAAWEAGLQMLAQ